MTGLSASGVSVTNGALSGFAGSGATYTFNVAPSGQGPVMINIAANVAKDRAGNYNIAAETFTRTIGVLGDLDGSGNVDLIDAILAFQVTTRIQPAVPVYVGNEVGGNKRIGMEDVIYILQKAAGVR